MDCLKGEAGQLAKVFPGGMHVVGFRRSSRLGSVLENPKVIQLLTDHAPIVFDSSPQDLTVYRYIGGELRETPASAIRACITSHALKIPVSICCAEPDLPKHIREWFNRSVMVLPDQVSLDKQVVVHSALVSTANFKREWHETHPKHFQGALSLLALIANPSNSAPTQELLENLSSRVKHREPRSIFQIRMLNGSAFLVSLSGWRRKKSPFMNTECHHWEHPTNPVWKPSGKSFQIKALLVGVFAMVVLLFLKQVIH